MLDRTLATTDDALTLMDTSLKQSVDAMDQLEGMTDNAAQALKDTTPAVVSIADLFGNDFSNIVADTRASLASAEASAQFVDDTLAVVSGVSSFIPFQSPAVTVPQSSLKTSFAQLSQSLAPLPQTLKTIQSNLKSTSTNLQRMEQNIDDMSTNIRSARSSLDHAQKIIAEYKMIIVDLKSGLSNMQDQLLSWLNVGVWGITLVLAWMVMAQTAMFMQGLEAFLRKTPPV